MTTVLLIILGLLIVLLWGISGLFARSTYHKRGHSATVGFLAGLLFGPLGMILAMLTPKNERVASRRQAEEKLRRGDAKLCPSCRRLVHPEATVCPHCQRDFPLRIGRTE